MSQVRLSDVQADLLLICADAYAVLHPQTGSKEEILYSTSSGGTHLHHHGISGGSILKVSYGDLEELDDAGFIAMRPTGGEQSGVFRVTNDGYDAAAQIEAQRAAAATSVVPAEGAAMNLEWEEAVLPVLETIHRLYNQAPTSGNGVSQKDVNEAMGRQHPDPHTSRVMYQLHKADYLRETHGTYEMEGPGACEPTAKTLELLAGWPTTRGDMALAQLLQALEAQIEAETDPEERGKLERLRDSLQAVGQGVAIGLLTKVFGSGL